MPLLLPLQLLLKVQLLLPVLQLLLLTQRKTLLRKTKRSNLKMLQFEDLSAEQASLKIEVLVIKKPSLRKVFLC
jgi:hypothetical protein